MSSSAATVTAKSTPRANGAAQFQAGIRPYSQDYYVPDYRPLDTDLLCAFRMQPAAGTDMIEAPAAVAAESSTGTWTEVRSNQLTDLGFYRAKAYRIEGDIAYIATQGTRCVMYDFLTAGFAATADVFKRAGEGVTR